MKRILLSLCLGVCLNVTVKAQMYVSPNSYVFVNDEYVYVKQDVNLAASGNFYLRNGSQLLQGRTTAGANTGLGNLSVFQEGTVNNYQYNYWCSPVGVPGSTIGNQNFGVTRLYRPSVNDKISSEAAVINTANGFYDGVALNGSNKLVIASRWVHTFVASSTYSQWIQNNGNSNIAPGLGFSMKGTSGTDALVTDATEGVQNNAGSKQRYDFRGKPNDGLIVNNVVADNQTLVGNPYPSAINLNRFLLENSGHIINADGTYTTGGTNNVIDGEAQFWEHDKNNNTHYVSGYVGGYGVYVANNANANSPGTYTPATYNTYTGSGALNTAGVGTGNSYLRMFSPVGQGFMVTGITTGQVQMKNEYRVFVKEDDTLNPGAHFEKNVNNQSSSANSNGDNWGNIPNVAGVDYTQYSKLPTPQIRLRAILNNQFTREVVMAFNPNTTDGFDIAMDAKTPDASIPKDVYFPLTTSDQFVISTFPFDVNKVVPFAFKANAQTTFKIEVAEVINFDQNQAVYVHDKVNDVYYDIKNGSFDVTLPSGSNKTDFEITFTTQANLSNEDFVADNLFQVYQNNAAALLTINNKERKDLASIELYDVTGKSVIRKINLGNDTQYEIPTNGLSDGVYIVKLKSSENLTVSKKVSVYNK
ncbi:T9SS sorting signal type C domain-containing protein [Flavobacterium chuncheonense]|uniref:T9SS sorting signal type C domain-containing protein n=1 Tax=Flavobacterium chuncheonense TaxID=2026653 RepID=A0ABW5YL83_9FLAO